MADTQYDVVAVGNAIVDVLAHADDSFLAEKNLPKGGMVLIDEAQAEALYDQMGPAVESSGGSAANTAAGLASLGSKAAYIGKVCDDMLGKVFRHDITAIGVHYVTPPGPADGPSTARCMVLVTPDAERTMSTYLGACTTLAPEDIDEEVIKAAKVTYIEGYLWDEPAAKDAIMRAALAAQEAGRKVALSLSDAFCVDRHRSEFLELTEGVVDVLFGNEEEIKRLYQTDDFDTALAELRGKVEIAAITRGAQGSIVVTADQVIEVPAETPAQVVDTTGAGDLYAAGFLHGLTRARPLAECARLGAIAAAEIISHMGPRPERNLAEMVQELMAV